MDSESEGKINYDNTIEAAASSQNSLAGESRAKWQTVARVNLGPEIAAILLKILLGSTCDNAEILGDELLSKKALLKRISSYLDHTISGNCLHSLLLAPTNEFLELAREPT